MSDAWSNTEVELIVADYFNMLSSELKGEAYSKAEHRRALLPLLANRSEGSIEFKHQNISAILINLGQFYIKGYLPRNNYQKILEDKVLEYLIKKPTFENQFKKFAEKEVVPPIAKVNFEKFVQEVTISAQVSEPEADYLHKNPIKINYLVREQNNRSLGLSGEELVIEYEKWNFIRLGKEKYANQIRWISKDEGDGAGFDILSKNLDGKDKYIEVKTTKLSKENPFFFSRNELLFSQSHADKYNLYRLYNFTDDPKMFIRNGRLDQICNMTPMSFKAVCK
jgi:hypothetical protein